MLFLQSGWLLGHRPIRPRDGMPSGSDVRGGGPSDEPTPSRNTAATLVEAGRRGPEAISARAQARPERRVPARERASAAKQSNGGRGLFSNLVRKAPG